MPRDIVLYGPAAGRVQVRPGSALERDLRAKGWTEIIPSNRREQPTQPAHLGASETARQAREALTTLAPEDWIRDWGYVLCAALDESEHARGWLVRKMSSLADVMTAGIDGMRVISRACLAWLRREPTSDGQAGAALLARIVIDAVSAFQARVDAALGDGLQAPRGGDPAARAKASSILDELAREVTPSLPADQRDSLLRSIARVRASLGGSNVPDGEEGGPS